MYKIKIYKDTKKKSYFWYFLRSIRQSKIRGESTIEEMENSPVKDSHQILFYINDFPIFLDARDDSNLDIMHRDFSSDCLIFKTNYSTELWNNPPENYSYKFKDWEYKLQSKIKAFANGRVFNKDSNKNERDIYSCYVEPTTHDVVSFSGTGLTELEIESRIKVLDLFDSIETNKNNLMFVEKDHNITNLDLSRFNDVFKKYKSPSLYKFYGSYIKLISSGRFSINTPGICVSQPFRFIDAVIANRVVISTKIWNDAWKSFPCIELPVCGYFGTGDWVKAKEILEHLDDYDYESILKQSKDWYSWFLSSIGMWNNQIIKNLEN